jgi:hypothetical protein
VPPKNKTNQKLCLACGIYGTFTWASHQCSVVAVTNTNLVASNNKIYSLSLESQRGRHHRHWVEIKVWATACLEAPRRVSSCLCQLLVVISIPWLVATSTHSVITLPYLLC